MSPIELKCLEVVKSFGYDTIEEYWSYVEELDLPIEMRKNRWECMKKLLKEGYESLGKTSSIQ